jgi:hypothetical protein
MNTLILPLSSSPPPQAYYEPMDEDVADYMYCETEMVSIENGKEISHVSGFVAGEIRTDCEVCYDSERLRSREVSGWAEQPTPNITLS